MVLLLNRDSDMNDTMPQTVPSAGFTPPCDYSNFAENFDLSLLPGGDQPLSPSTQLYAPSPLSSTQKQVVQPKIYTTFYPNSPPDSSNSQQSEDFGPDFQQLLSEDKKNIVYPPQSSPIGNNIYLEVPANKNYQPNSPLSPYSTASLLSPNDQFINYRQSSDANFYPSSPELSLYTPSPNSVYSRSPCGDDFLHNNQFIKQEHYCTSPQPSNTSCYSPYSQIKEETNYLSPCGGSSNPTSPANSSCYSSLSSPEQLQFQQSDVEVLDLLENTVLDKQIKQESTVDFSNILQSFQQENIQDLFNNNNTESKKTDLIKSAVESNSDNKPKDHQLLREVLRDTSFQKKYNIKTFDFGFISNGDIKMEEPDDNNCQQTDIMQSCNEQLAGGSIEPVLSLAIEQMRKDVDSTCAALQISHDPSKWSSANVLSWIQWTSRQFGLPEPVPEQWDIPGSSLTTLSEQDFSNRAAQGGMILHAQLEIWKAAYSDDELSMNWIPETTSSNASSGDISDEDEEDTTSSQKAETAKPSTSTPTTPPTTTTTATTTTTTPTRTGGSHIHLWQFLKELLSSPQTHGSCIRWLDRTKGIFKIEDSVKVARLWGKRKNRPAMNYDKLSRSIRQYYKKGIMKKTERSQRLVYQFCHPYNL